MSEKQSRFRTTMTWAEYFTELNKLCEELDMMKELMEQKKQEKNDDTPKR